VAFGFFSGFYILYIFRALYHTARILYELRDCAVVFAAGLFYMLSDISSHGRQDYYVHGEKNNRIYQESPELYQERHDSPGG
jgi:hypothetical protein